MTKLRQWLCGAAAVLLIASCAGRAPPAIREAPPANPAIAEVRRDPQTFHGTVVRWGGTIASVRNLKDETLIEIVGRRLDGNGRPREEDHSEGRFLAKAAGFIDPAVHANGREITVRGAVEGTVARTIGEFPYTYPVVRVEQLHLWEPRPPPTPDYPPYYYDPFWYDPWYPWGHPYWPHYRLRK